MKATDIQERAANAYTERMILPSDPLSPLWNKENVIFRKQPKWNYIDACMMNACAMLSDLRCDDRLAEYIMRFTEAYVTEEGGIPTLCFGDFNLDNVCGGRNLLWLYRHTGMRKYLAAAENIINCQLAHQPRTPSGNFWHKAIYPGQIWLDGVYMALPFMAEYGVMTGDSRLKDDVSAQLMNIRSRMRDSVTGLYYHGMDESRQEAWADPVTGLSGEFWLRSLGWLSAGLADICSVLPDNRAISCMLRELLEALAGYMTDEGMLLQLPCRSELPENYPETSGTLLFAYSAMMSARLGVAGKAVRDAGIRAFRAVSDHHLSFSSDGMPLLENICLMAGLGGSPYRDGTAAYYLSEQKTVNDAKGIAPFLMAYTELNLT